MPTYLIHDNGGRPFRVVIDGSKVHIYKKSKTDDIEDDTQYSTLIDTYTTKKIFVGKSSGKSKSCDHTPKQAKQFDGNSLLLQLSATKYVFIGMEIFSFEIKDEIEAYYSPVGRNDFPYPLILGKENVYFLLEKKYVPRDLFPKNQVWEDAYAPYYGTFTPEKGWVSEYTSRAKKMKTKQIQKRVF